jgi:membrane protein required for colicin V production
MAWVDYFLIGIVLVSVLVGALRGFIREALSLVAWVLAFVLALRYGPDTAEYLRGGITSPLLRTILGYVLPFFAVLFAGGLLIWIISWVIRGAGLAPVDRMLGSGFGLLRGAFIVVALVMLAGLGALGREPWWKQSMLVPQLQPLANQMQALIPARWLAYLRAQAVAAPAYPVTTVSQPER